MNILSRSNTSEEETYVGLVSTDVGRGGMGVVPTGPDERVLGWGSAGIWGGCSCMEGMRLDE